MEGAPLQLLHTGCQLCGATGEGEKQRNHPCPAWRDTLEGDPPRLGARTMVQSKVRIIYLEGLS